MPSELEVEPPFFQEGIELNLKMSIDESADSLDLVRINSCFGKKMERLINNAIY